MSMRILPSHMSMYFICTRCPETSEKSIGSPATGVTEGWGSLCGSQELNLGPL